jgi:hypothetical protein
VIPECIPRHESTLPFVPNTTVDTTVKDLIGKLEIIGPGSKREAGTFSVKGRVKVKQEEGEGTSTALDGWQAGGYARKDWIKRERPAYFSISFLYLNAK